jgi:hypothetical protein
MCHPKYMHPKAEKELQDIMQNGRPVQMSAVAAVVRSVVLFRTRSGPSSGLGNVNPRPRTAAGSQPFRFENTVVGVLAVAVAAEYKNSQRATCIDSFAFDVKDNKHPSGFFHQSDPEYRAGALIP